MSGTNPCACMVRFHELRSSVGWNVMQRRLDRAGMSDSILQFRDIDDGAKIDCLNFLY